MLDLESLWIGDLVKVISTSQVGKFEGINRKGIADIKINNQVLPISANNLILYKEKHIPPQWEALNNDLKIDQKVDSPFKDELDLHIEKLRPDLANALPQMILNYQIIACKNHIASAIKNYRVSVKIIHGKGTGQLKQEVYHLLGDYPQVKQHFPSMDGGAVEIWFGY